MSQDNTKLSRFPSLAGTFRDRIAPCGISIRNSGASDGPFLTRLAVERLSPCFAGASLAPEELEPLLLMQVRAQAAAYAAAYPHAFHGIIQDARSAPVGRLIVNFTPEELRLVDIVLHAHARGRGLGTALIQALLAEAAHLGLPVRLAVTPDTPAFRLYSRLGFQATGYDGVRTEMERAGFPHQIPAG